MAFLSWLAGILPFRTEAWLAIPWHLAGIAGVAWMIHDSRPANSALNPPLKACRPILICFILGTALS